MNTLKFIALTIAQFLQSFVNRFRTRRSQLPSAREIEAERIDRIRFPSKYIGK